MIILLEKNTYDGHAVLGRVKVSPEGITGTDGSLNVEVWQKGKELVLL